MIEQGRSVDRRVMRIVAVFGGPRTPPILWWITGSMLMIEMFAQLGDRGLLGGFDLRTWLISYGAFWDFLFPPGRVDHALFPGQSYVMLISHAFLHAGTLHVIMNAVIFLALAKTLALVFGIRAVLITMLLGAIGSGVGFGVLENTAAPMVGASGVVFCFIGVWLDATRTMAKTQGQAMRSVTSIIIGLVLVHVLLHVFMGGMIAWQAHLGGFVVGFFLMPWVVRPLS
jgi:membrane associated rhomboid family serine protease